MTKQLNTPLILREEVQTQFGMAAIVLGKYEKADLLAVQLVCAKDDPANEMYEGEPIATLSFNPVDPSTIAVADTAEFFCKTWSVNADLVRPMLDSGLFERVTYKGAVLAGMTSGEIWRLKGSALEQYNQALAEQESEADGDDTGPGETPKA